MHCIPALLFPKHKSFRKRMSKRMVESKLKCLRKRKKLKSIFSHSMSDQRVFCNDLLQFVLDLADLFVDINYGLYSQKCKF